MAWVSLAILNFIWNSHNMHVLYSFRFSMQLMISGGLFSLAAQCSKIICRLKCIVSNSCYSLKYILGVHVPFLKAWKEICCNILSHTCTYEKSLTILYDVGTVLCAKLSLSSNICENGFILISWDKENQNCRPSDYFKVFAIFVSVILTAILPSYTLTQYL